MRRMVLALIVALVCTNAGAALGSSASARDPNDVRGPLDIKRISHGHRGAAVLWHRIVMHRRWGAKDLRGDNEVRLYISRDGEDRFDEVHISIDEKNGNVRAWIFPYTEGSDFAGVGPSERIRLRRPSPRVAKVFFEKSWVRNRRDRYAWSAGSDYRDRDGVHCRKSCYDYAPGNDPDRVVHRL